VVGSTGWTSVYPFPEEFCIEWIGVSPLLQAERTIREKTSRAVTKSFAYIFDLFSIPLSTDLQEQKLIVWGVSYRIPSRQLGDLLEQVSDVALAAFALESIPDGPCRAQQGQFVKKSQKTILLVHLSLLER
jgi:hypothetical protein